MTIQWINYGGPKSNKYMLVNILGTRNHKICILECQKVPSIEVKIIREASPILATLPLTDIIRWIKQNCPASYRLAYKELLISKIRIINQY